MNAEQAPEALRANLKDAGCSDAEATAFLACGGPCEKVQRLRLLGIRRKKLLEQLHTLQHRLECLDYLIHQIKETK